VGPRSSPLGRADAETRVDSRPLKTPLSLSFGPEGFFSPLHPAFDDERARSALESEGMRMPNNEVPSSGKKRSTSKKSKSKTAGAVKKTAKKKSKPKEKTSAKSEKSKSSSSALKVSNQIPKERRRKIQSAMAGHKRAKRTDWDRVKGVKQHRILKKRVKPGTIRKIKFPLLDVTMGEDWQTPITVIHGARPGPVVTITGAIHGDELIGPLACSLLCQETLTSDGKALDPLTMAGTVRIAPILNPPGFRQHSRYFPDGRDLNREFPGSPDGNTTQRVANRIWELLLSDSDYIIDLHAAARGRSNLPQVRADLAHPESNKLARAFGIEVILDSKGPRGTLRRVSVDNGIGCLTYEGGGANVTHHEAVQVAVYGVLNSLRSLHVLPGNPSRPRFRLLASGSTWLRAEEGGLIDMLVEPGSFVEEGDIIGRIVDPQNPGIAVDIVSPERGLLICTANNPFVHAGTPIGHLLPINRGVKTVKRKLDAQNRLIVSGSQGDPAWREEAEVDEIAIEGSWSGGAVDAEWQRDWAHPALGDAELAAAEAEEEAAEEEQ